MPWYNKYKQVADNTSINIPTPTGKSIVTDNSPYTQNQFLSLMEGMRSGVQYDKQQEQNRISQRKSAEQTINKNQPFTLPSGQTKKFSEMDFREKRYVEGTALENRGRFFPNEESLIDDLNPLNWIASMAGNMSKAPLEAQQSDSYMPYVTALTEPLLVGAMASLGTQNTKQFVNNIVNPLAGVKTPLNKKGQPFPISVVDDLKPLSDDMMPYIGRETPAFKNKEEEIWDKIFPKNIERHYNPDGTIKNSNTFDNYLSQKQAVQARAERMLSQENKWIGQNNDELITNFNNASKNHYDDLTSFEWNSKFNDAKSPETLGVNKFGKTVVYKDAPLSEANKARTAAHETGHYYRNTFEEGKDWNSFFDFSLQKQNTRDYLGGKGMRGRGHIMGDEIRERAAQLKDYIAHKNKIPLNQDFTVTKSQLDDALKNYTKDTKLDNTMTPFISSLKDKNGFLKAMNKYALTTIPAAIATGAATQEYQNGGQINNWTDKYKN